MEKTLPANAKEAAESRRLALLMREKLQLLRLNKTILNASLVPDAVTSHRLIHGPSARIAMDGTTILVDLAILIYATTVANLQ